MALSPKYGYARYEMKTMTNEYHSLITYPTFGVICEKCDKMLDGHDNVIVILNCPSRMVSTYVHALFSHREISLQSSSNHTS